MLEQIIQGFGLCRGPGKTVQQEPSMAVEASGPFRDHRHDQSIGDQFTTPHGFNRGSQRRAVLSLALSRPKDIPRRKMACSELLLKELGLGALPDPRRPQHHEPVRTFPGYNVRTQFTPALKPRGA